MIIEHRGAKPVIDTSATIAPSAIISGDVAIGPHTVVLAEGTSVQVRAEPGHDLAWFLSGVESRE